MSKADDYKKYARRRRFQYPGESRNGNIQGDRYEDRCSAPGTGSRNMSGDGFEGNVCSGKGNRKSFNTRDPYADEAELAIQNGDYSTAMEALTSSISEYNNINSVKLMGELWYAAFIEAYGENGLDSHDRDGMGLAQTVLGTFFFYMTVKSAMEDGLPPEEEEEILEYIRNMAIFFRDIHVFNDLVDLIQAKIEQSDIDTLINHFLHGGF